jgi:hypothetical protein
MIPQPSSLLSKGQNVDGNEGAPQSQNGRTSMQPALVGLMTNAGSEEEFSTVWKKSRVLSSSDSETLDPNMLGELSSPSGSCMSKGRMTNYVGTQSLPSPGTFMPSCAFRHCSLSKDPKPAGAPG